MIFEDLTRCMEQLGYVRGQTNVSDIYIYVKPYENGSRYVFIANTNESNIVTSSNLESFIIQIQYKLTMREPNCEFLTLIITNQVEDYRKLAQSQLPIWIIDEMERRLIIYEYVKEEDKVLSGAIERCLDQYCNVDPSTVAHRQKSKSPKKSFNKIAVCSIAIILVNVIIYFLGDLFGSSYEWIEKYSQNSYNIVNDHEYYRFFTCMFLHSGISHLFNNMLMLYVVGDVLERTMSKIQYISLYIVSGVAASILSMLYDMNQGILVYSIGASGAIYGLVGALFVFAIFSKEKMVNISIQQIMLFVLLNIYLVADGEKNIDYIAHIAGFFVGAVLGMVIMQINKHKVRDIK